MNQNDEKGHVLQFGVFPNCNGSCDFCLREERIPYSKEKQLWMIENIKKNISIVDWKEKFKFGISLLGGELFYTKDRDIQNAILNLIDCVIEKILKISPSARFSTVTNGNYDPTFLYQCIDKVINSVDVKAVDVNFSYDLKYRFKDEESRLRVLKNINDFHNKYDYKVGVQMILTQYVIDMWKNGKFDVNEFIDKNIPGNMLCFLYPHKVNTGILLKDFQFNRNDFFAFVSYLKSVNDEVYLSFLQSTKNSAIFKYTGLKERGALGPYEEPKLSDGKEIINKKCGHSILYQCYADSDKCMLCDLETLDEEAYL